MGFVGEWSYIVGAEDDKVIAVDSDNDSDTDPNQDSNTSTEVRAPPRVQILLKRLKEAM